MTRDVVYVTICDVCKKQLPVTTFRMYKEPSLKEPKMGYKKEFVVVDICVECLVTEYLKQVEINHSLLRQLEELKKEE